MMKITVAVSFMLQGFVGALIALQLGIPVDAAPSCYSDAGDAYIDSLNSQGEKASEAGRHLAAMRDYERLAIYNQRCVEPGVAAFQRDATHAVVDVSSTMRQMFYTRAISAYLSAAKEAKSAGLRAERCRFARKAVDDEHRAYPNDGPDSEATVLLRGC
jgi:hypothetical protein